MLCVCLFCMLVFGRLSASLILIFVYATNAGLKTPGPCTCSTHCFFKLANVSCFSLTCLFFVHTFCFSLVCVSLFLCALAVFGGHGLPHQPSFPNTEPKAPSVTRIYEVGLGPPKFVSVEFDQKRASVCVLVFWKRANLSWFVFVRVLLIERVLRF